MRTSIVEVPTTQVAITASAPVISGGNTTVVVPFSTIAINGIVPLQIGRPRTTVSVPTLVIAVAAEAVSVRSGTALIVPTTALVVTATASHIEIGTEFTGQTPGVPELYGATQDWEPEPWAN